MRITVLVENEGRAPYQPEHGLSLYLQYNAADFLLDAGQSDRFLHNARLLGCTPETLDTAVLSHGHYDHADGFAALFACNDRVKVYARSAVMQPQYGADGRYIGLCDPLLTQYAHRFDRADEMRQIAPGLWLVPDTIDHEQSLVAETPRGLVVMNSCCHAGGDHIVADILQRFPGQRVHALIGGLHLMGPGGVTTLGPTPDAVCALTRRLTDELGVDGIYTGHCTGAPALALMQQTAGEKLHIIHTGDVLEF